MKQLPGLFIGRFQPFHLGHLDALEQVFEHEDEVIIVIGSAENPVSAENPFTASERRQMIEASLSNTPSRSSAKQLMPRRGGATLEKKWRIIPVKDINNDALWVSHVASLVPPFGKVYTGSPDTSRLFKEAGRGTIVPIIVRKKISGTEVRRRMKEGEDWEDFVPAHVATFIKKINGVQRIKGL